MVKYYLHIIKPCCTFDKLLSLWKIANSYKSNVNFTVKENITNKIQSKNVHFRLQATFFDIYCHSKAAAVKLDL